MNIPQFKVPEYNTSMYIFLDNEIFGGGENTSFL